MTRSFVVLCVAALSLAACGGDDDKATTTTLADVADDDRKNDDGKTNDDDSDDSDSGLRDQYVDALVGSAASTDFEAFGPGALECLAPGFVDAIGVDALVDRGITPDEIREAGPDVDVLDDLEPTPEIASGLADVLFECIDFGEVFAASVGTDPSLASVTDEQWGCAGDAMESSDVLRQSLVDSMLADESDNTEDPFSGEVFASILEGCGIASDLLG